MGIFSGIFKGTTTEVTASMDNYTTSGMVKSDEVTGSISSQNSSSSITEDTAMKIAALYQGITIIADNIAAMPVYLYKDQDGFQEMFPMDLRSKALSDMANDTLTAFNLKRNMVKDLILYGNAYAKITREGEKVKLDYLPNSIVTPKKDNAGYYFQVQSHSTGVMGENVAGESIDYFDMLVLVKNAPYNSVVGTGLLEYASDVLNMATEETSYMLNLFKNGLSAKAILSSKTPLKREVKEQLKSDLKSLYSGASNSGKILVLEGDVGVSPLALTPTDIKLIENKHFSISEIARFLNIPKHMLALDRQQGTYSNITQERLQLLQSTLTPYVVAIEGALNQKLLTEEEQNQGYYFQFNTSEMLKLTPEDNASYMLKLYQANIVTLEEVRASLNLGGNTETIALLKQYDDAKESEILGTVATETKITDEKETSTKDVEDKPKETQKEKKDGV